MRKAERIQKCVDVLHTDAVDQHVRSGVVTDGDHHGSEIAKGDFRDTGRKAAHDVAVLDQVRSANCIHVRQFQLALLRLPVELRQHANLDRTGLGKNIVRMQKILVTVSKIEDGNAHGPIEIAVHLSNRTLELLPESLLLFLRGRCSDLRVGDSARQQTNDHQDEGDVRSQGH